MVDDGNSGQAYHRRVVQNGPQVPHPGDRSAAGEHGAIRRHVLFHVLAAHGVVFSTELDGQAAAGLWELEGSEGTEYWVGFDNLYVITRYNRSVMYALAAWQLGQAVVQQAAAE